jgi:tetratricopeptide (TPR) repeat protein
MSNPPPVIDEAVRLRVYSLFKEARAALLAADRDSCKHLCNEAWALIPDPKFGWDVSYMCVLAMAEFLRDAGALEQALDTVDAYLASPYYLEYQDGPHFWLGTIYFEQGRFAEAFLHMDKANGMSRGRCFAEQYQRYKAFFTSFRTDHRPN